MDIEVKIIKGIPTEQINRFEDKVVYNVAAFTRETTKSHSAFPYLTGKLQRSEVAEPINGSHKEYSLGAGVDYAVSVWKKTNANWTNPSTQPQWYKSVFNKQGNTILHQAVNTALKEI